MSKAELEGLGLSAGLAARIVKPAFRLLVTHPSDIERMHLADLNNIVRKPPHLLSHLHSFCCHVFDVPTSNSFLISWASEFIILSFINRMDALRLQVLNGLDVVELRAVFGALPEAFANDGEGKKAAWRDALQAKLRELTASEAQGTLPRATLRHPAYGASGANGQASGASGAGGASGASGASGAGGAGVVRGPCDPTLPLPRRHTVASTAFDKVRSRPPPSTQAFSSIIRPMSFALAMSTIMHPRCNDPGTSIFCMPNSLINTAQRRVL